MGLTRVNFVHMPNSANYYATLPTMRGAYVQVLLSQIDTVAGSDSFECSISTFDRNFSTHLMDLLNRIMEFHVTNCEHKLMNILYRFTTHFTH